MKRVNTRWYRWCSPLFFLLMTAALTAQTGGIPDFVTKRFLYEPECEQMGAHLLVMDDTTASSDQYVAATATVFPTSAPGADAANYVRLHFEPYPTNDPPQDYRPYFRIRQETTGPVSLWLRTNGSNWQLRTFPTAYPTADAAGWMWMYDDAASAGDSGLGLDGSALQTLDIAFTHADQQLDQVYLEDASITARKYFPLPFEAGLVGTNCSDFSNIPPVAVLEPGQENLIREPYPSFSTYASDSYDPDGIIVRYNFNSAGFHDYDPAEPYFMFVFENSRDQEVSVTVYDWYGASDSDTSLWRIFPADVYTSNRPYYRLGSNCAQAGDYWSLTPEPASEYGPAAVGGTAASTESPPDDLPEHQLRYVIRDVPTALDVDDEYISRYYLGGVFDLPTTEGNCLWVNINETGWTEWKIIEEYSYFNNFYFDLQEGDNTIRLAYCSPELQVNYLVLSPDTGYPSFFDPGDMYSHWVINQTCPDPTDFWLEAECADFGERWKLYGDPAASRGGYLAVNDRDAYHGPPADEPRNYVRFTVPDAAAGTYQLQALIRAPSNLEDSYYVRVNDGEWYAWKSGIKPTHRFHWNLFPGGGIELRTGDNTVDFAYREDGTGLDKIYIGKSATPIVGHGTEATACELVPPAPVDMWLEAECATVGSAWTLEQNSFASNYTHVVALTEKALTGPPPAEPDNLIRFEWELDAGEANQLLFLHGRVSADSPDKNSFWVRYNGGAWYAWKSIWIDRPGFQWQRLPVPLEGSVAGTNTLEIAYRENGTLLDGISISSLDRLPSGPPTNDDACGPTHVEWEAECGVSGSDWTVLAADDAGSGQYVQFTGARQMNMPTEHVAEQELVYRVDLAAAGNYHLFLRLNARDNGRNSVWVQVDDGDWIKMWEENGGAQLRTHGFEWRKVNHDGGDVFFPLEAGPHTIRIANREAGTAIDRLLLSFDPTAPSSLRQLSMPCPTLPTTLLTAQANTLTHPLELDDIQVDLYPNPVADVLTLDVHSDYSGPVIVTLYDPVGRRIHELQLTTDHGFYRQPVPVADLPPGIYHLRVVAGELQVVKTFLRL